MDYEDYYYESREVDIMTLVLKLITMKTEQMS